MSNEINISTDKVGVLDVSCVVNGPIQTNTYFACSKNEAIIVDPAWEGERLVRDFLANHPKVSIKAIVCTHAHADHMGGVAGARRVLGPDVPFIISNVDAQIIPYAIPSMKAMWGFEFEEPPAPDRTVGEGDTIDFGGVSLQVLMTPGHTPGGMVLYGALESGDVAFVGDTLFPGAHGRTDLEGGDELAILDSLGKLGHYLPAETLCLCGHNGTTTIGEEAAANLFMRRGLRHYR